MAAGLGSAVTFIKKLTASGSANLTFVNGSSNVTLDGTYKLYMFVFNNIHPATDDKNFTVNFRDGGSNYDAPKITSYFHATHAEGDGSESLSYITGHDLNTGATGAQILAEGISNDADHGANGYLYLYNPGSTVMQKQITARSVNTRHSNIVADCFIGGNIEVTAAVDGVQFAMSSGNIDSGTISLFGIG